MDATCAIQDSIHVFNLVHKYVSRILGTYQGANPLTIIVIIGLIGGGIYYFKSKSGKQGKPAPVSENMEDDYEEPDDVEITYQDDPFDKDEEDEDTDE